MSRIRSIQNERGVPRVLDSFIIDKIAMIAITILTITNNNNNNNVITSIRTSFKF